MEEPLRQACFDPLLTLHLSDESEAVLQKPNLRVRGQALREIAYPTTSPDLQEIRYLHPGLLGKIKEPGVRRRADFYYQQLDGLRSVRRQVRRELLVESEKHKASKLLRQIPSIGPIRAALLLALVQTPHRFRTKRQLWTYSGFGIETHDSAEYRYVAGQLERSKKPQQVRGLNRNYNHDLKNLFKSAATNAVAKSGPLQESYLALVKRGIRPGDGPSHRGAQDRRHHISDLEERSELRRQTSETTNSLSVSAKTYPPSLELISGGGQSDS